MTRTCMLLTKGLRGGSDGNRPREAWRFFDASQTSGQATEAPAETALVARPLAWGLHVRIELFGIASGFSASSA